MLYRFNSWRKEDTQMHNCYYSTTNKRILKEHIISIHEGKKLHKYPIFDSSASQGSASKCHIDSIHDGTKPYKCTIYDYSAAKRSNLKYHLYLLEH